MGSATYTIPVEVPPGISSNSPSIALFYDSLSPVGELGLGWSLQGLSAIQRCPTNLALDGFIDGVDYDANDQFCLDGRRLVVDPVSGEYVAEDNGIVRAIPHSITNTTQGGIDPSYWEVYLADGQRVFYGANAAEEDVGARIHSDQTERYTYRWEIAQSKDGFGNSIDYQYLTDYSNSVHLIQRIGFGVAGGNEIIFDWGSRSDATSISSVGQIPLMLNRRLERILVNVKGQLFNEYKIHYRESSTQFSLVESIEKCSSESCLIATTVGWREEGLDMASMVSGPGFYIGGTTSSAEFDMSRVSFGDFNGDGITDIYRINSWGNTTPDSVYLYNSDGTYTKVNGPTNTISTNETGSRIDLSRTKFGDFNGDGITDVYRINGWGASASKDTIFLFRADGTFYPISGPSTPVYNNNDGAKIDIRRINFGDFNGDGITDIYYINGWGNTRNDTVYLFNSTGGYSASSGPATYVGGTATSANIDISRIRFEDFNGDGITDVYKINGWGGASPDNLFLFSSDGSYRTITGPSTSVKNNEAGAYLDFSRINFGDFNGDGITDVYVIKGWNTAQSDTVFIFSFDGSFSPFSGPATFVGGTDESAKIDIARIKFGDFNGDGITDVYRINGWGGAPRQRLSF